MRVVRSGKQKQLTFEREALQILELLAPNRRSHGSFLSALLRQEEARRLEARKFRTEHPELLREERAAAG